jgi:hypothetical protein
MIKYLFYVLCPIPALCLIVSWMTPNNFNAGGPSVMLQFELLAAILISSPILTFIGFLGIAAAISDHKSTIAPCLATTLAALPGIYFLWGMLFSKN